MIKQGTWPVFIINIGIAILVFCIAGTGLLFFIAASCIEEEFLTRARSGFNSILITHKWNSIHNGVYVLKEKGEKSGSFRRGHDIRCSDGKIYTLKSPSVMTIEISEIGENKGLFTYKMISLNPVNPSNTPDDFETMALTSFEHGLKESFQKKKSGDRVEFRYMAPLPAEEECMRCHGGPGYKPGDVLGGISVTFDITAIENKMFYSRYLVIALIILSIVITGGLSFIVVKKLKQLMDESITERERLAVTDDLTGLYNRRYFFTKLDEEFERTRRYGQTLSLIIIDIDDFKLINDRHGHEAGDNVLREVASVIRKSCRESDTPSRYGNGEFAVILPSTAKDGAASMAEKLIKKVSGRGSGIYDFKITISIGISILTPEDAYSPMTLVYDADSALNRAKSEGKNRYVIVL